MAAKKAPASGRGSGGAGGGSGKRQHRATYATDKIRGGYIIRVAGPYAARFAGREVPVTTKGGDEHSEQLTNLIWSGPDEETGEPVALYNFKSRPREELDDDIPF